MNEVKNTLKELMGTKKAEPTKAERIRLAV